MGLCDNVRFSDNFMNEYMNHTYNSYSDYKSMYENAKLQYLIHKKYLKLLGKFIETIYPNLRFDIFIRNRNPKEKKVDWYGMTYMELVVFDVICSPPDLGSSNNFCAAGLLYFLYMLSILSI